LIAAEWALTDRAEEIGLTLQHYAGVPLVWVEHADGQAKALSRRLAHFFDGALRSDPRQHRAALIDHALDGGAVVHTRRRALAWADSAVVDVDLARAQYSTRGSPSE
jgi:hypothetical protein